MHVRVSQRFIKPFSSSSSPSNWRSQIKQTQIVSQISSILLQRHNWEPLLQKHHLLSYLTPPLLSQILLKTQTNPKISLDFFNWVKSHLNFEPELKSQCHIIKIALQSGISGPAKSILESLIQTHPATVVVECMIRGCEGNDSKSEILSFVLEFYSRQVSSFGWEAFRRMRFHGIIPSVHACNALLDVFLRENEISYALCVYCAMIRDGIAPNRDSWSILAQIYRKKGKLGCLVRLLELDYCNSVMYELVIDGYSEIGDFGAAFGRLSEMFDRKMIPSFSTYSSILNGACKYRDSEAIERIVSLMKCDLSENGLIIEKLCDLGKTYAAEMIFERACDEKVGLRDGTYGCMLRALSKEGRVNEAIELYNAIVDKGIEVDESCFCAFGNLLCKEEKLEVYEMLRDVIRRGYCPGASELSAYITLQCSKRRWREAEELLNLVLDTGSLPDSLCCGSMMKRYCSTRQIGKAIALHEKLEKLKGVMDGTAYDMFLDRLWKEGKSEEAVRVFDYMRGRNMVSSASFASMIRGLCRLQELRSAMKLHDEMLKMGLKPEKEAYKRLIAGFS